MTVNLRPIILYTGATVSVTDPLKLQFNFDVDSVSLQLQEHNTWQNGTGDYASPKRKILGSFILAATLETGSLVRITHVVLRDSLQWAIGRNVTRKAVVGHVDQNVLVFPATVSRTRILSMTGTSQVPYLPFYVRWLCPPNLHAQM